MRTRVSPAEEAVQGSKFGARTLHHQKAFVEPAGSHSVHKSLQKALSPLGNRKGLCMVNYIVPGCHARSQMLMH